MASSRTQIRPDLYVFGSDGGSIGTVHEVRASDFLVNRPLARDVYVPFSAIRSVADGLVMLNIEAYQVDHMGWPNPP